MVAWRCDGGMVRSGRHGCPAVNQKRGTHTTSIGVRMGLKPLTGFRFFMMEVQACFMKRMILAIACCAVPAGRFRAEPRPISPPIRTWPTVTCSAARSGDDDAQFYLGCTLFGRRRRAALRRGGLPLVRARRRPGPFARDADRRRPLRDRARRARRTTSRPTNTPISSARRPRSTNSATARAN